MKIGEICNFQEKIKFSNLCSINNFNEILKNLQISRKIISNSNFKVTEKFDENLEKFENSIFDENNSKILDFLNYGNFGLYQKICEI